MGSSAFLLWKNWEKVYPDSPFYPSPLFHLY